jgi:N-formylmaleamate deformylase
LHYYRTGHGDKPPVVLLHGFSDNGLNWTPIAKALEADYDVVMPDTRGHGLSGGSEMGDYSQEAMAADIADVIRVLNLQKVRLLGHSMGGSIASRVAAEYPELVHSVVLEDPAIFIRPPKRSEEGEKEQLHPFTHWIYRVKAQTREERIAAVREEHPRWSEEELGPWADSKDQLNLDVLKSRPRRTDPFADPFEILQRITCPILLITGDIELGAITTPQVVEKAVSVWHDGQVLHIAGASHNIRRDEYEQYIAAVKKFFEQ